MLYLRATSIFYWEEVRRSSSDRSADAFASFEMSSRRTVRSNIQNHNLRGGLTFLFNLTKAVRHMP